MEKPRIVILGGGTAGWMAACLFAEALPAAVVTVVESPQIGIIGVGEGSTPQLAALFARLGLAEQDWMPRADATWKAGIAFAGWSGAGSRYFHPFASALDLHTEPAFHAQCLARRRGLDVDAHPDRFFLNSRLAAARKAPLPPDTFPFETGRGYHFDAHRVGEVLRQWALDHGVHHLPRQVLAVDRDPVGNVAHLRLDDATLLAADLFVDASGFAGVIAQQALGVRFQSFADNLFVDRAVVLPTPVDAAGPVPFTAATILSAGWAWAIPLTTRIGNGYVYSSRYLSADAAEAELRAHLGVAASTPARHLAMKVGRVETSWTGNCLAIGLAQGFLEPLEATALHLVQSTLEGFLQAWRDGGYTPRHRDVFNAAIARRYEGVRDYLVAHYRLNRRRDTPFWRDNAAHDTLSDSLKALMTCWFTGGDLVHEIARQDIGRYYAPLSWGCLFAGYDTWPQRLRPGRDAADLPWLNRFLDRCADHYPGHAQALASHSAGTN